VKRTELLRLHALHKAAAEALEAKLKNAALDEYTEQDTAVSWRLSHGLVTTGIQAGGVVTSNREDLLDYLEEHTAAVQRIETRDVSGAFLESFMDKAVAPVVVETDSDGNTFTRPPLEQEMTPGATFPVADAEGRIVPGLQYVTGGRVSSISIRLSDATKAASRKAAARYADGELSAEEYFSAI